jgi:hypothetical protein
MVSEGKIYSCLQEVVVYVVPWVIYGDLKIRLYSGRTCYVNFFGLEPHGTGVV